MEERRSAPPCQLHNHTRKEQLTLQDLRAETKDIVDHDDRLVRVLGSSDIGLVTVDLLVRSFGGVFGLDRR
jgi:hypothetical protein